jgi:predicted phage terminase large subunit-like protein
MFKVDHFQFLSVRPEVRTIVHTIRAWDKAGTADGGAYTAGVKMSKLMNGSWLVEDVKRGRWSSNERERIIRETAEADGLNVEVWLEQEPGSAGKESAEGTIRNLAGFVCKAKTATGDKPTRADAFSVQVNIGAVSLMTGLWNHLYLEELRFFPFSTFKDQTDASSLGFSQLVSKRIAHRIT